VNEQPRTKEPIGGRLFNIINIWRTIQGEGPFAGTPAVFLRLAHCNLQCPFCDTDYTTNPRAMNIAEIMSAIAVIMPPSGFLVITGGEPFLYKRLSVLCQVCYNEAAWTVQIETNGTIFDPDFVWSHRVTCICSPKANIHPRLEPFIDSLKYVLRAGEVEDDGLPTRALGGGRPGRPTTSDFHGDIYLQPQDDKDADQNKQNIDACVQSCMKHGYSLSLQLHKILGLE
jgi:7-carboxy-7-deazaguanine synthase